MKILVNERPDSRKALRVGVRCFPIADTSVATTTQMQFRNVPYAFLARPRGNRSNPVRQGLALGPDDGALMSVDNVR